MSELAPCATCGRRPTLAGTFRGVAIACGTRKGHRGCSMVVHEDLYEAIAAWNAQQADLREEASDG